MRDEKRVATPGHDVPDDSHLPRSVSVASGHADHFALSSVSDNLVVVQHWDGRVQAPTAVTLHDGESTQENPVVDTPELSQLFKAQRTASAVWNGVLKNRSGGSFRPLDASY